MEDGKITLIYSIAMAVDAIASLITGRMYDKVKERSSRGTVIVGMLIFGIVMGTHETIMRSAISDISPYYKRGTSYGIFNAAYGLALMVGSYFMGLLYDLQMISVIQVVTIAMEALAVIVFLYMMNLVQKQDIVQ